MLNINDFEKTGEYRDVKVGEYFICAWDEPKVCNVPRNNSPRHILKPKERLHIAIDRIVLSDSNTDTVSYTYGIIGEGKKEDLLGFIESLIGKFVEVVQEKKEKP